MKRYTSCIEDKFINNLENLFDPWVWFMCQEDPLENGMATTPVFLLAESHEQRSLEGYSPWNCKESDTTEELSIKY